MQDDEHGKADRAKPVVVQIGNREVDQHRILE